MTLKVKPNWPHLVELYKKSGLSKAEFCRSQKISLTSFSYHSNPRTSAQTSSTHQSSLASFFSVREKQDFKLTINDSLTLSFNSLPDAMWLSSFIKSLRGDNAQS